MILQQALKELPSLYDCTAAVERSVTFPKGWHYSDIWNKFSSFQIATTACLCV